MVVWLFLLAAVPSFAEETDPVPGLTDAIQEQMGIELSSCPPEQATRFLEQNYQPYCGSTELGSYEFQKAWKKALRKHPRLTKDYGSNWRPYTDDFLRIQFWFKAKPGFVLFNDKTGFVLIGMDISFVDCDSMSYLYPGYADGALVSGVAGVSQPETVISAYPQMPSQLGYRGKVSIRFESVIDETGVPTYTCILEADPPISAYMAAAYSALKKWRYIPAMKDGQPVKVLRTSEFSFEWH